MSLPGGDLVAQVVDYHGPDVLARLTNTDVATAEQATLAPATAPEAQPASGEAAAAADTAASSQKRRRTALDVKAADFFVQHASSFALSPPDGEQEALDSGYRHIPSIAEFLRGELASTARRLSRDAQQCARLRPGHLVKGRVIGKPLSGLLVSLDVIVAVTNDGFSEVPISREHFRLRGCCSPGEMTSERVDDDELATRIGLFSKGDNVVGLVLSVDMEHQRVLLSFNRNRLAEGERDIRLGLCRPGVMAELVPHPTYPDLLQQHEVFRNPASILELKNYFDLSPKSSFIPQFASLTVPKSESAAHLRRQQDRKVAGQLVADGVAHQKTGRMKDALRCYDRALQVCPDHPDALVARGALHTTSTDFERATQDLRRAMQADPDHKNARNYLETTYLRAGQHHERANKMQPALAAYAAGVELRGPRKDELKSRLATLRAVLERRARLNESAQQAARATYGSFGPAAPRPSPGAGAAAAAPATEQTPMSAADMAALLLVRQILKAKKKKKRKKHKKASKSADSDVDSDGNSTSSEHGRAHSSSRRKHSKKRRRREHDDG